MGAHLGHPCAAAPLQSPYEQFKLLKECQQCPGVVIDPEIN